MSLCSLFLYHRLNSALRKRELGKVPVLWSLQSEESSTHKQGWQNSSWSAVGAQREKVSSRGGTGERVAYGKQTAVLSVVSWQHEEFYHTTRSILMLSGGEADEHLWKDIYCVWGQRSCWKHAIVQTLLRCGFTMENWSYLSGISMFQ